MADAQQTAPAAETKETAPVVAAQKPAGPVLDADGNGLYDDAERKLLLDVFQQACPELKKEYDTDGDGTVTKLEQTAGEHPLSQRIPASFLGSGVQIPWGIDIFPEWITTAYFKEDLPTEGGIERIDARGTVPSEGMIRTAGKSPVRLDDGSLRFPADGAQKFVVKGQKHARWSYRWCLLTFRVDGASGTGNEVVLVDVNSGKGSGLSTPKIWYARKGGLHVQYVGAAPKDGIDRRLMVSDAVVADGTSWNVLVCGIRQGRMYAEVNGVPLSTVEPQGDHYAVGMAEGQYSTYIGDGSEQSLAWDLDALVFGLSEPSESMVRKLGAWGAHRLGFNDRLPAGHPYRSQRPIVDEADFPHRYVHDNEAWLAWGATLTKANVRVNMGGERVEPQGWERVFYDDFRANRLGDSREGSDSPWMAPGFNTAVGASIPIADYDEEPNAYPYDADNKIQTVSLVKGKKTYKASALYTVNDMNQGYTWAGPKIFRIRCRFPDVPQKELAAGLFPAFWSYDTSFTVWRTANRIEVDWFEFDGHNGRWYNGVSTHYHYAHQKNDYVKQNESYKRYKIFSGELTKERLPPNGLYFWDGAYHTWEFVVGPEMFYVNVTLDDGKGGERWVEVCRSKTAPTYLERLDLQVDYALKERKGSPGPNGERQDFDIDWIEVLQPTTVIDSYDAPYTGKPSLSGAGAVGATVRCDAKLDGITDVRYYWFADGYPITYGSSPSFTVTEQQRGASLRCMVKAVGATSMPEAWTDPLPIAE